VTTCEEFTAAEAITAVDEPIVDLSPLAEHPQAWPVLPPGEVLSFCDRDRLHKPGVRCERCGVTPTVHCTCPTLPCPKHPQQGGHGGDGRGAT
jgi:hypothetical protein